MKADAVAPMRLPARQGGARNIADKKYVANCTYGCFYGEPRTIAGTASYRW